MQVVEAEFSAFLETHSDKKPDDGHKRIVRHGHLRERKIVTGIGEVSVKVPRARERKRDKT